MPVPAFRVKQTTQTTGTGELQLDPASTQWRSFQAQYGAAAQRVRFCILTTTGFEVSVGDFDGGIPGRITRAAVLASSNGGSLLSLPAGTKDVFAVPDLDRQVLAPTSSITLGLADLNSAVAFQGTSGATIGLPAVATVPPGAGFLLVNNGTAALTIDPNGAETIGGATTLVLQPGESCEALRIGGGWVKAGGGGSAGGAATKKTSVGTAAVDFALSAGITAFRLTGANIITQSDGAVCLRASRDGGATWGNTATYYHQAEQLIGNYGVPAVGYYGGSGGRGYLQLTNGLQPNAAVGRFDVLITPGSVTSRFGVGGNGHFVDSGGFAALWQMAGHATAVGLHTHIQIFSNTSTIAGTFWLEPLP